MIPGTWFIWSKFWHHHASQSILEVIHLDLRHQGLKTLLLVEACPYQFQTVMYDLLLVEHQLVVHDDEAGHPLRAPPQKLMRYYYDFNFIYKYIYVAQNNTRGLINVLISMRNF